MNDISTLTDLVYSIPYLIRFRQCMVEYTASSNQNRKPLYNAVKYASSFPVIYLSTAQRTMVPAEKADLVTSKAWQGGHSVFRLWQVNDHASLL
jgi:EXS family